MARSFSILVFALAGLLSGGVVFGQVGADGRQMFPSQPEVQPQGLKESLDKMRIEKEKKDYSEMLARSEEAQKIAAEVKTSFTLSGVLSNDDLAKIAKVEKLVKKVRDGLGGDGDDGKDDDDDASEPDPTPASVSGKVDALKEKADTLHDLLKGTTRFTISAEAIHTSNGLLKLARLLKAQH